MLIKGRLLLIHRDTLDKYVQALCARLNAAKGRLYTIKPSDICNELYGRRPDAEELMPLCYSILRDIVKETLWGALLVEHWLRGKVIVDVDKAKKLLGCTESRSETLEELSREYPEVASLAAELASGVQPSRGDVLREVGEAMGWDVEDAAEELKNLAADPSERVGRYAELFQKYYGEARRLLERGDYPRAAERLWGAATALIKLHAALRGVFVAAWSRGKLYSYVARNVEEEHRQALRDMLKAAEAVRRYSYERDLDPAAFKDLWEDAVRHIEGVKGLLRCF
jgi:hypothetical protein